MLAHASSLPHSLIYGCHSCAVASLQVSRLGTCKPPACMSAAHAQHDNEVALFVQVQILLHLARPPLAVSVALPPFTGSECGGLFLSPDQSTFQSHHRSKEVGPLWGIKWVGPFFIYLFQFCALCTLLTPPPKCHLCVPLLPCVWKLKQLRHCKAPTNTVTCTCIASIVHQTQR